MGFFDKVAGWLGRADAGSPAGATGMRSPWTEGQLQRIVVADLLGLDSLPVNRAEAMSVPAIARARHILCADAARSPLQQLGPDGTVRPAGWLHASSGAVSPQHRMVWTVDDLIHYGWSLWLVQRDDAGTVTDAARCPIEWWKFDATGTLLVQDQPVPAASAVLIPGFHEGIIALAPETIRGARKLEEMWINRAQNPVPAMELHQTTPDVLDRAEIIETVSDWTKALNANGGAVAWTPHYIDARPHGEGASDLFIHGRNAAAIDAARHVGVPAAMVDASNVNSTLTYETLEGRGGEYLERSLPLYLGAIEARLSLDDVTPSGDRVRADISGITALVQPATGTPTED